MNEDALAALERGREADKIHTASLLKTQPELPQPVKRCQRFLPGAVEIDLPEPSDASHHRVHCIRRKPLPEGATTRISDDEVPRSEDRENDFTSHLPVQQKPIAAAPVRSDVDPALESPLGRQWTSSAASSGPRLRLHIPSTTSNTPEGADGDHTTANAATSGDHGDEALIVSPLSPGSLEELRKLRSCSDTLFPPISRPVSPLSPTDPNPDPPDTGTEWASKEGRTGSVCSTPTSMYGNPDRRPLKAPTRKLPSLSGAKYTDETLSEQSPEPEAQGGDDLQGVLEEDYMDPNIAHLVLAHMQAKKKEVSGPCQLPGGSASSRAGSEASAWPDEGGQESRSSVPSTVLAGAGVSLAASVVAYSLSRWIRSD